MAGTILGPDQIIKVNRMFPALVAHLRDVLAKDHSGVGLMRVHCMVESFDSDEMARIFRELSFISPKEKLALVRAALYELLATDAALFVSTPTNLVITTEGIVVKREAEAPKVFTPPQHKLNINTSEKFTGERPADTNAAKPVVTSTHTPKVANNLEAGKKESAAQQEKLNAAVAKLREANTPKPAEE